MKPNKEHEIFTKLLKELRYRLSEIDCIIEESFDVAHAGTIKRFKNNRINLAIQIQQIEAMKSFWEVKK